MNTIQRTEELCREYGITLSEISRKAKLNHSTLMSARRRNNQLSVDTIEAICIALGISMSKFFEYWTPVSPSG